MPVARICNLAIAILYRIDERAEFFRLAQGAFESDAATAGVEAVRQQDDRLATLDRREQLCGAVHGFIQARADEAESDRLLRATAFDPDGTAGRVRDARA